ncbi:MAG: hypothetical protein PHU95_03580 [Candidatus Thermoplasmatota archaeon]|nr:hypothetical protein [Candidatus Thermoplasmatota archaeon]MDD5778509.1 hypothetical protein [Candidatus Thermoplasmatota archaeon]
MTDRIHVHTDGGKLERMTVQVSKRNIQFLEEMVKSKVFRSRSHGADYCINLVRTVLEKKSREAEEEVAALMG